MRRPIADGEWLQVDDADKRVKWVIRQRAGYEHGVVIDVRTKPEG